MSPCLFPQAASVSLLPGQFNGTRRFPRGLVSYLVVQTTATVSISRPPLSLSALNAFPPGLVLAERPALTDTCKVYSFTPPLS